MLQIVCICMYARKCGGRERVVPQARVVAL